MHLNLFKPPIQVPVTDPTLLKPTGGHLNVIIFNPKKHEPI